MKNAEWMLKNGMEFSKLGWGYIKGRNIVYYHKNNTIGKEYYSEKSVRPENMILKWLDMEHKEQVLDDAEKSYLSAFIRPFRDRVKHICRINYLGVTSSGYQYIYITLSDDSYDIDLPIFKKDTMYKGMKAGHCYTLEELGL